MANIDVMYSSKTDQWATPDDFFKELDQEFHFNLDPCADEQNHKCEKYFTKEDNGLSKDWGGIACFAILRMVEQLQTGLKRHTEKERKTTRFDIVNIGLHFILKNVRPYAASCSEA